MHKYIKISGTHARRESSARQLVSLRSVHRSEIAISDVLEKKVQQISATAVASRLGGVDAHHKNDDVHISCPSSANCFIIWLGLTSVEQP